MIWYKEGMRKATIHGFKAPYLYLRGNGNYLYRRAIPAVHAVIRVILQD